MPDHLNDFINEAATQSVNAEEQIPVKCVYCTERFATFTAWYEGHFRECHKRWKQQRAMEQRKRARPAQTPEELKAAGDPFEKLKEED